MKKINVTLLFCFVFLFGSQAFAQTQKITLADLAIKVDAGQCKAGDYNCQVKRDQNKDAVKLLSETKVKASISGVLLKEGNAMLYVQGTVVAKPTSNSVKIDKGAGVFVTYSW